MKRQGEKLRQQIKWSGRDNEVRNLRRMAKKGLTPEMELEVDDVTPVEQAEVKEDEKVQSE